MKRRKSIPRGKSRRSFTRHSGIHGMNAPKLVMRGGLRL